MNIIYKGINQMNVVYIQPPQGYDEAYIKVLALHFPKNAVLTANVNMINFFARRSMIRNFYISKRNYESINKYIMNLDYNAINMSLSKYNNCITIMGIFDNQICPYAAL